MRKILIALGLGTALLGISQTGWTNPADHTRASDEGTATIVDEANLLSKANVNRRRLEAFFEALKMHPKESEGAPDSSLISVTDDGRLLVMPTPDNQPARLLFTKEARQLLLQSPSIDRIRLASPNINKSAALFSSLQSFSPERTIPGHDLLPKDVPEAVQRAPGFRPERPSDSAALAGCTQAQYNF